MRTNWSDTRIQDSAHQSILFEINKVGIRQRLIIERPPKKPHFNMANVTSIENYYFYRLLIPKVRQ